MKTNTKAVVTGDRLGVLQGTGAFWELAVIIYVQHLQICFKSGGTVEKSLSYKVYGAESAFLILISDLLNLSNLLWRRVVHGRVYNIQSLASSPGSLWAGGGEPGTH